MKHTSYNFSGVASLITVLSLGTLVFIISLATSIISYYSNQNVFSASNSLKAYYAAYSGIEDALLKLERNKDYSSTGYNLSLNSSNDIAVSISNSNGTATITSSSTIANSSFGSKIQTIATIDTTTGLVTPTSTIEQNL